MNFVIKLVNLESFHNKWIDNCSSDQSQLFWSQVCSTDDDVGVDPGDALSSIVPDFIVSVTWIQNRPAQH